MKTTYQEQLHVITQLLYRDFYIFKNTFLHRLKMALYWVLITVFIAKMFLPELGLVNFAPLLLISSAISYGLFVGMQNAMSLVEDICSDQAILYELSLPVPHWVIFLKIALNNTLQSLAISLAIIPCGMVILYDFTPFPDFSFLKFITIFVCASIFYGAFSLILATVLKNMDQVDNVWLRVLFPLWYLGCFQFPWATLYKISPTFAYLDILNPMTCIMEAGRSATIDTAGSLPFWPCCILTLLYAGLSCYVGIYWLKKRLDCI